MFVYYISIMLLVPTGLLVTEENMFWRRVDCRVDTGIFLARSLSIQMYVGCIEPQYKLWQEENRICLWCWMDIGNKRFFWIKKRYCPLTQEKAAACTDSSSWDADGTGTLYKDKCLVTLVLRSIDHIHVVKWFLTLSKQDNGPRRIRTFFNLVWYNCDH